MQEEKTVLLNKLIYPKKVRHYNMSRKANKVTFFVKLLERLIVKILLKHQKYEIIKENMELLDKKEPYLILSNHMQFLDFELLLKAVLPKGFHGIMNIEAYKMLPYWLIEWGGTIPKRKFTNDIAIVRSIIRTSKTNDAIGLFPEARYTVTGELANLPDSLGKVIKLLNIPIVVFINHGNFLVKPVWGNGKNRKLPVRSNMKLILTKEQIACLSIDEINKLIEKEMYYDEFVYQKESNILIKEDFRAEGLHKILYKCPHCGTEFEMSSYKTSLKCNHCNTAYFYNEDSSLTCENNTAIFTSIRDWLNYEREEAKKELLAGNYSFEGTFKAYSFPHPKYVINLGDVFVKHSYDGFVFTGKYNGYDFCFKKSALENYAIQTEYGSPSFNNKDLFALSTNDETIFFEPTNPQIIHKLYYIVEELYKIKDAERKKK
ncbi:MAG: hypothetical protein LBV51_05065 [Acholeplasmatales bacterium]|jgi:DNA-directed RNA polymerase subunit RPC12/RpoP|nr:hypothetical protein [Acholeplasmatales bacterium]